MLIKRVECALDGWSDRRCGYQAAPAGFEEPLVEFGEEISNTQSAGGDEVAVRALESGDEAPSAQSPQVIGHLVGSVGAAEKRFDQATQIPITEAVQLQAVVAEGGQEGHGPRIAETQGRDTMAL